MDIKSKMKDFDWKKIFIEKGEKIGLCVAGGLAGLMLLWFMLDRLIYAGPGGNAEALAKPTHDLEDNIRKSQPGQADNPPEGEKTQIVFTKTADIDPKYTQLAQLTTGGAGSSSDKRLMPSVYPAEEGYVVMYREQMRSWVFDCDDPIDKKWPPTRISVEKNGSKTAGNNNSSNKSNPYQNYGSGKNPSAPMPGMPGPGGRGPGNPFSGRPGGGGRPGTGMGMGGSGGSGMGAPNFGGNPSGMFGSDSGKNDKKFELKKLEKFDLQTDEPENKVHPLRVAEIGASFPYRKEIEEFQRKLNLASYSAVLADVSGDVDPKTKTQKPAFQFLGVDLERQEVDPSGGFQSEWYPVDLNSPSSMYKIYFFLSGKKFDDEPVNLKAISFPGLVMGRLKSFGSEYPAAESLLPKLKATLNALSAKDAPLVAPPKYSPSDDFDVFAGSNGDNADAAQGPGMPGGMPGPGGKPGPGGFPGPGGAMPGSGSGKPQGSGPKQPGGGPRLPGGGNPGMPGDPTNSLVQDSTPPDYCLVRVIDVTIVPGVVYRYRLRIKMANPNKDLQKSVYSPSYAKEPFLVSDWYEVPQYVFVPPENYFYAVDQKELDGKDYKGQNFDIQVFAKDRMVMMQLDKWLVRAPLPPSPTNYVDIGEWVVAERVPVYRGDYLGRHQRVEVPFYNSGTDSFMMMPQKDRIDPRHPGVLVDFKHPDGTDQILVDFEGGELRYEPSTSKTPVVDKSSLEVLVLSPDGRLLAHDSAVDKDDKERKERLAKYHTRIKDVKSGKTSEKGGDDASKPFGK